MQLLKSPDESPVYQGDNSANLRLLKTIAREC